MDFVCYKKSAKTLQEEDKLRKGRTNVTVTTRSLMETISKAHKLERGTRIPEILILDAIYQIRRINKHDKAKANLWLNRLKKLDFIRKVNYNIVKVVDTGQDWGELE